MNDFIELKDDGGSKYKLFVTYEGDKDEKLARLQIRDSGQHTLAAIKFDSENRKKLSEYLAKYAKQDVTEERNENPDTETER